MKIRTFTNQEMERLENLINVAAHSIKRRFTGSERSDLIQEGWLWCYQNIRKLFDYLDLDEEEGDRVVAVALRRAMEIYARRERAHRYGYEPDDEFFYSTTMLAEILPYVIGGLDLPDTNGFVKCSPSKWDNETVHNRFVGTIRSRYFDPDRSWNMETMRADVAVAYKRLPHHHRHVLDTAYGEQSIGVDDADAQRLGWTKPVYQTRRRRALQALVRILGGSRPRISSTRE